MNTGNISNIIRSLGLINAFDHLRFHYQKWKNWRKNEAFLKLNPGLKLPEDRLLYESFKLDYDRYYEGGKITALWLKDYISKYVKLKDLKILDWGCGPGRVIRHLPSLMDNSCTFYGTDTNLEAISWCNQNLPGIHFYQHSIIAQLPFPDDYFDVVYGISVFTHLSESAHFEWFNELYRIMKISGVLLVTTQGVNFKKKLTSREYTLFNEGKLVVRGKAYEGSRTFSAFQPVGFMHKLFEKDRILNHKIRKPTRENAFPQDLWIVRKDDRK